MSDHVGAFDPGLVEAQGVSGKRHTIGPISTNVPGTRQGPPDTVDTGMLMGFDLATGPSEATLMGDRSTPIVDYAGWVEAGPHVHWFEHIISKPQAIALGNMLSTVLRELEIYSSYRTASVTFTSATNNAGAGITFIDLPSLPVVFPANSGAEFQVQVTMQGPSTIDGTLDFVLSVVDISIPITGSRVVMLSHAPEAPISEKLEFLTAIDESANGKEQRAAMRGNPRQRLQLLYKVEEGPSRRELQALLFKWHPQVFGLPVWFEARELDADLSIGSTVASVDTRYGDFRVDGLCILWTSETVFETLEIASLTDSSITFSSDTTVEHTGGKTLVMPLRLATTEPSIKGSRHPVNLDEHTFVFTILDNEANIGDTSAFDEHNSKVLLHEGNLMRGNTMDYTLLRRIDKVDNEVGSPTQFSDWDVSRIATDKGFTFHSMQRMWEIRQLVHALRGSQVTFYLPTFRYDIVVSAELTETAFVMDIESIGYTEYIQAEEPLKSLWIELTDGTILTRQVTGYTIIDSTTERLTVDEAWSSTIDPADIARVSFLLLCRISGDSVEFQHTWPGEGRALMKVLGVSQ